MIRSMTGYGSAEGTTGNLSIQVDLKAVNHRHLDVSVRMPRLYLFAEDAIKKQVAKIAHRGKVDVFVHVEKMPGAEVEIKVDEALAGAYLTTLQELSTKLVVDYKVGALDIARLPDVLSVAKEETDTQTFSKDLLSILDDALSVFDQMRKTEGDELKKDILTRLTYIENIMIEVERLSPQTVNAYREKLYKRMQEVLDNVQIEESRILTEAALFADKIAVDEEITRLRSHLAQFREMLAESGQIGRKLDFLLQELGREMNTIGSKCNDLTIGKMVIDGKAELEKIREQVQNIE